MTHRIPPAVISLYSTIQSAGFEVFFVGGCVRNMLMELPVKDWDITTNATPDQIQEIFPDSFYENTYGTVGVPLEIDDKTIVIEITTFRREERYNNRRHPESVEWGENIEDDLSRRDFTCNAIAFRLTSFAQDKHQEYELIDPFNGQEDIEKKIIRTVRDPEERFNEDALRLMRAIRFATQLNFEIEQKTWDSIVKHAQHIQEISRERIRDELLKILESDRSYEGVILLDSTGLLDYIIPELANGKNISQVRPGRHHTHDVFTHNLLALKYTPSTDPIVRLATLLHDVGKPDSVGTDEDGHITFYNHEVVGAKIAARIADNLRLSKKQREKIYLLIRWHMFSVDEQITDHAIRRFIRRVGIENVSDIIDLRIGDRLGSGTKTAESWRLRRFKEMIEKELNPPFSLNDMAVDGSDVMKELNIKPGPKVGIVLQTLFREVDEDLSKNNREYLLKRIHEIASS